MGLGGTRDISGLTAVFSPSTRGVTPDRGNRLDVLEDLLQRHGIPLPPTSRVSDPPPAAPTSSLRTGEIRREGEREATHFVHNRSPPAGPSHHQPPSSWIRPPSGHTTQPSMTSIPTRSPSSSFWQDEARQSNRHGEIDRPSRHASTSMTRLVPPFTSAPFESIPPDRSPHDQSSGTLVIDHNGRSKYLGPSAASEWLRDVRPFLNAFVETISKRSTSQASHRAFPVCPLPTGSVDIPRRIGRHPFLASRSRAAVRTPQHCRC